MVHRDPPPATEEQLQLFLCGGFRAKRGGEIVPDRAWQRPPAKSLVKLLAMTPGHALHREQILDMLWPDADVDHAGKLLTKALHFARHALEPGLARGTSSRYLHFAGEIVSLDREQTWVDADVFAIEAQEALTRRDIGIVEAALERYAGDLLPEDRYAEWAEARREHLSGLQIQLLLTLAELREERGEYRLAAECLHQVLQRDPAREEAHRQLMRLHAVSGSRHQALRQYEIAREALRRELDVALDPETDALYQDILSGRLGRSPIAPVSSSPKPACAPGRLPVVVERLLAHRLLGRERAAELLTEDLRRAVEGQGGFALIGGEAGIGKTRLAAQLARQAQDEGAIVLWGASHAQEGRLPYGPLVEALERFIAELPLDERQQIAYNHPDLLRLLPSLDPGAATREEPETGARTRLVEAVVRLLSELASRHTMLLVLDDLHAADTDTLELVHRLARVAPERCWLLVGTYREEDVVAGGEFQQMAARVTREAICRRVTLGRLSREESDQMVEESLSGDPVDPALLARIYNSSLGNPLYTQELVRSMQEQGQMQRTAGSWGIGTEVPVHVPAEIREIVDARVDLLDDDVRRVLTLAASAGMESAFNLLSFAARVLDPGWSQSRVLDALDAALRTRILEEHEEGYAFRHPMLREALYERLSRQRRAYLHATLAEAIRETTPGDIEALAHHYVQARNEDMAVVYLEQAGDRAASLYAHEAARGYYQDLLDRLDQTDRRLTAARVREKLGAALRPLARYDEALAVLERAAFVYRETGDLEGEARVAAHIGETHWQRATPGEGVVYIDRLLARFAPMVASGALVSLYLALNRLHHAAGRYAASLDAAKRAGDLARVVGDRRALAEAEILRCRALSILPDSSGMGRAEMEQIVPLVEETGDLASLYWMHNTLGVIYTEGGQLDLALREREQAYQLAEHLADPGLLSWATSLIGLDLALMGQWEEARRWFERGRALIPADAAFWLHGMPLLYLGMLLLRQGEREGVEYLERAVGIGQRSGDLQTLLIGSGELGEWDLKHGRWKRAIERLEPLLNEESMHLIYVLLPLATAYLEEGNEEAAQELLEDAKRRATLGGMGFHLADVLRIQARLQAVRQQWDEAAESFEQSIETARSIGSPYPQARAHHDYGRLLAARGDEPHAARQLEEVRRIFHRLGVRFDAEQFAPPPAPQ